MADDGQEPSFDSDAAALAHFRDRCRSLQSQLATAEHDILDFTESSKELQAELEQELERVEAAEKSIRRDLDDARNAADDWRAKYTGALRDHTQTMSHMQRELETLRATEKSLRARVRDMELDNDDLEKSEREKDSSLQDLESRYNKALERIALLEEELVTKAQLDEEVQRLKDELREVNEELSFTRTQLAAAPPAPYSAPSSVPPTPVEPESPSPFPSSSAASPSDDDTPRRRTPSPTPPDSPSPSIELTNPTPLLSSRIRPSAAAAMSPPPSSARSSPSKIARSTSFSALPPSSPAPFRAPLVHGAPPLARSTRTAHLARTGASGLTSSPSTPNLSSPAKTRPGPAGFGTPSSSSSSRLPQSPARGIPRTDTATMIRDMQQMTTRVRALTSRLDQRRVGVMRGSAIPRMGSPTGAGAGTAGGGMARSATMRGLGGAAVGAAPAGMRPPSRLGAAAAGGDAVRESSRPASRSSNLRASLAPSGARPPSRVGSSSLSASSAASLSRPASPAMGMPSRSPTPTQSGGASLRTSTRPGSALGRSLGPSASSSGSGAGASQVRRPGSAAGHNPPVAGLSRSVHGRSGSAASSTSGRSTPSSLPMGPPPRRPGSALSHHPGDRGAGAAGKTTRRVSGGFGLLGRSMRRRSTAGEGGAEPVPPLPSGVRGA
ncbi:hypothetical protein DMC30DRAFT_444792 [Rhodotorula diobovata]|uniref:NUDE domain-containing protein n=1 Tax=Rhodotorula diobovata TaxID=5288 RepID=A0A5C5G360_9BASI|nr:hypothetical protein DMC30DRAFT_444792 [Rhodotorula diobovata]